MSLKLVRGRDIFRRDRRRHVRRPRPQRVALFPALRGAQSVERKPERNPHQPAAKPVMVAKPVETLVRPEQRLLRDILRIRRVTQDSARNAKSQRAAFGKTLFEFPPGVRLSLAHQLAPCRADWLVQDQLLHRIPSKLSPHSAPGGSKEPHLLTIT